MLTEIAGAANAIAGVGKMLGIGSKGTSRKREYDSYVLQSRASREDIPLRVQAYKDAGIHPLYGLGGQQFSPSPTSLESGGPDPVGGLEMMGQGLERAGRAQATAHERAKADQMDALQLERARLENDLLRTQISTIGRPTGPALPSAVSPPSIAGQGDAYGMTVNPLEATASRANSPHTEAGAINDVSWVKTKNGWTNVMSNDAKQRLEEDTIGSIGWSMRNRLPQAITGGLVGERPPFPPPEGAVWAYNGLSQEWYPMYYNPFRKGGK